MLIKWMKFGHGSHPYIHSEEPYMTSHQDFSMKYKSHAYSSFCSAFPQYVETTKSR